MVDEEKTIAEDDKDIRHLGDTDEGGSDIDEHGEVSPEEPVEVPPEEVKSAETEKEKKEETVASEKEPPKEKPSEEEEKKSKGVQKRIDELVRQREDAKRQLTETETERDSWRKQAIKNDEEEDKKKGKEVKAGSKPSVDDYENYDDYVEALTDYKVSQMVPTIREQFNLEKKEELQNQKLQKTHDKLDAGKKKYDDFDEVAMNVTVPYSQDMLDIITDSDNTADIAYYFGKNISEAERVSRLPALEAAREIGKIEAKFDLKESEPKPKKITNAPEPVKTVGGSDVVTKKPSEMTYSEYKRWRQKSQK